MKTGIISLRGYSPFDYDREYAKIKSYGFDCVDYQYLASSDSPVWKLSDGEREKLIADTAKAVEKNGLEIYQAHGLWPADDLTEENRLLNAEFTAKQIRCCKALGCKRLVIHTVLPCGYTDEGGKKKDFVFKENVKRIEYLLPVAKECGVILCVENLPFDMDISPVKGVKKLVDFFSDENVKFCFDTGHANYKKEDIYQDLILMGKDIEALHVHDNRGLNDDHTPPYTGKIDWTAFKRGLKDIGFNGCISLETGVNPIAEDEVFDEMYASYAKIAKNLGK